MSAALVHTNCRFSPAGWPDEGRCVCTATVGRQKSLHVVSSKQSCRSFPAQLGTSVTQIKSHSHIKKIIHNSSMKKKKSPEGGSHGWGSCQLSLSRFLPSLVLLLALCLCSSCGGSTAGSTSLLADSLCCLEYLLHLQEVTTVIL